MISQEEKNKPRDLCNKVPTYFLFISTLQVFVPIVQRWYDIYQQEQNHSSSEIDILNRYASRNVLTKLYELIFIYIFYVLLKSRVFINRLLRPTW